MPLTNNQEIDIAIDGLTQTMLKAKLRKLFQLTRSPIDEAIFNRSIKQLRIARLRLKPKRIMEISPI